MRFYKYTPALLDPKTLEDTLIGRDLELDNIKRILKSASSGKSFSHPIVIGPKGIGKSHILRIIYHAVNGEIKTKGLNAFKDKFIPVIFSEEEYPGNLIKFIKLIINYLSESDSQAIPPVPEELMKAVTLNMKEREIALDYIRTFRKKSGNILLLLVDNLNDILERFTSEDQSALRDLLMTCDSLLLIGAAPTLFDSIINHDRPLYNFFEIVWLKDLPFNETILLLNRYAELGQRSDLLEKFKKEEAKLRAIHELAGGNPRLILSLYHIILEGDITSVEDTFLKLLDELSPYFRERMKDLSEQQKEIVDIMARAEGLLTPTEIAARCHMSVNIVLSQIKRLEKVGYLKIAKKHAKKVFYDFNERLFSLWRQMRVEAGRKRLGFIVKFLEMWFTKEELKNQIKKLLHEIRQSLNEGDWDKVDGHLNKLWYVKEAVPEMKTKTDDLFGKFNKIKENVNKIVVHFQSLFEINHEDVPILSESLITILSGMALSKVTNDSTFLRQSIEKAVKINMKAKNESIFFNIIGMLLEMSIKDKDIQGIKFFLHGVNSANQPELLEFLSPYSTLLKYLETKDPETIDRLRHEERIVVEDMIRRVEGETVKDTGKKKLKKSGTKKA